MKTIKIFALAAITVMGLSMCSQKKEAPVAEEEAVDSCAVMPQYGDGMGSFQNYISENLNYPEKAEEAGLEGRVLVNFVVEKDGSVSNVEVAESVDSILDAEAIRVISSMPAWTPGQDEKGEAVRVIFTCPIVFLLEGTNDDIDKKPEFPGGLEAYIDFMSKNLQYPKDMEDKGIEGRVLIKATIDENGKITNPFVLKSANEQLDAEAMRVVKAMPTWTPGQDEGKAVAVSYVIPVTFKLK